VNGRAEKPLAGNQAGLFPSRQRLYAPRLYARRACCRHNELLRAGTGARIGRGGREFNATRRPQYRSPE
jgi:hypothetical protein